MSQPRFFTVLPKGTYLEYYSSLEQNETELRKIRHDFANILQTMETCIAETDSPEERKLYKELCGEINGLKTEHYCPNGFVNAILSNKARLCREKGITPEIRANIPAKISFDEMDLCRAMVNIIDNAVNASAADTSPNSKKVTIELFENSGFLFIKTENNFSEKTDNGENEKDHGFGQKLLSELAEKYEGAYLLEKDGSSVRSMISMKI